MVDGYGVDCSLYVGIRSCYVCAAIVGEGGDICHACMIHVMICLK